MASLEHTLLRFQHGGLSREQLLAQVDQLLASDRTGSAQLTEILNEERTRTMLAPDVIDALRQRAALASPAVAGGDTSPSLRGEGRHASTFSQPSMPLPLEGAGSEPMKGVGDTLNNRFVLEECIGFGGMGMVYKALDLRKLEASDRKPYIAIKVLNVQFRAHPKSLIALQREAKKAQTLAHPNIVAVYDFDRDGNTVYLTMEYLQGKPLSQVLRDPEFRGMPFADAMRIVDGMGRALAYAHERGFVHCDFKPANVILTDRGEVKVIDFGIARAINKPTEDSEATVFDPGSLGGLTPAYASAEMLEHRDPDPRDDIYALACIAYELLTGRHPFERQTAAQARNAALTPRRPPGLGLGPWRALRRGLAFSRDARTPSVQQFLHEMGTHERRGRPLAAIAGGTAIAALLSAGGAYWWASSPRPAQAPVATAPAAAPPAKKPDLADIERLLAQVPCAALQPAFRGDALTVDGLLPASYGAGRLKDTLAAAGVAEVRLQVQEIGEAKCGIVTLLAPYWKQNRQAGDPASIRTRPAGARLQEGDKLVLDLKTPGYESYVNVDYFSFDGSVVHLLPGPRLRANQAPPNHEAALGTLGNWVIGAPFGTDLIVLLVTPSPLFDGMRKESEKGADYLAALERQLKQMKAGKGADRVRVDFLQITTSARKE
ncbi:hypothetical protein NCCP691_36910 [Noviherbaspirillum aridicola]|uniref:Protein kinase domain-containing protein n=2 Tax=Noviherbaspirillum aridicola TaxID=2849687 RepID=A0ABQ4Q9X0_9BURK|nr:hypothetical protein NCCP691_36910 [Noviherbaspirillum aridicola]